ncbi:MAG: hypothetical protein ACR2PT_12615 [Endozoicomonas sp.]
MFLVFFLIIACSVYAEKATQVYAPKAFEIMRVIHGCSECYPDCFELDQRKIKFGELLKYVMVPDSQFHDMSAIRKVERWEENLKNKLVALGIPGDEYQIVKKEKTFSYTHQQFGHLPAKVPDTYMILSFSSLAVLIGNWEYLLSTSYQSKPLGDSNRSGFILMVKVMPYHFNDSFWVHGREYSAYEMQELFISEVAGLIDDISLSSATKRVDINVGSENPELLYRMMLDVESNAWLAQAFGTNSNPVTRPFFSFHHQGAEEQNSLGQAVTAFNRDLSNSLKVTSRRLNGKGFISDTMTYIDWRLFGDWRSHSEQQACDGKPIDFTKMKEVEMTWKNSMIEEPLDDYGKPIQYSPVKIRASKNALPFEFVEPEHWYASDQQMLMEFRFLPPARNKEENRLLNWLLIKWFEHLEEQQQYQQHLNYEASGFENATNQRLSELFEAFITRLGLSTEDYRPLFRGFN